MSKEVISIFVDNSSNVLTRVASLFGRRGFNIESLTVSTTNDPRISRITVVFNGGKQSLHQILTQTRKLEVVKDIFTLDKDTSLFR
ncbi:acetolactate synthase small subunit, partial [Dubosiella newyorkensis]